MERRDHPSASDAEDAQPLLAAQDDPDPPTYPATESHPQQPPDYQLVAMGNPSMATNPGYAPAVAPGTVITQQPMKIIVSPQEQNPSAVGAISFSCFVIWCCCIPFGLIAFIFAVISERARTAEKAARHIRLSHAMSCAGLISGIAFTVAFHSLDLRGILRPLWKYADVNKWAEHHHQPTVGDDANAWDVNAWDSILNTWAANATLGPY